MRLRALTHIPTRVRLAYQLLHDYEAEQEPLSFGEAMALIRNYTDPLNSQQWMRGETPNGASAWKDAALRKVPLYPSD